MFNGVDRLLFILAGRWGEYRTADLLLTLATWGFTASLCESALRSSAVITVAVRHSVTGDRHGGIGASEQGRISKKFLQNGIRPISLCSQTSPR
ncbi:hypothetical protein R69608_05548 [Paraburkholderia nemoris]|nr:hypothetical protein R69608_05548 [Paraburkholderia nemoris]